MHPIRSRPALAALTVATALGLLPACGGGSGGTTAPSPVAPTITAQPASQSATTGQTVTFTVSATGTTPLHYQWRKDGAAVGTDLAMLTILAAGAGDAGAYSVTVTNLAGSVVSAVATLTVSPAPVAPAITAQPVAQRVRTGLAATFTVTASGTAPMHYQWKKDGAATGTDSATLTIPAVAAGDAGSYLVTVSNAAGSVDSAAAALTVAPLPARIVFEYRALTATPQTDIYSAFDDGTGQVALANSQDDEAIATFTCSVGLGGAPPLAISGDRVIYRRSAGTSLSFYSVKVDGTGTVPLVSPAELLCVAGGRLIFNTYPGILLMNADGTSPATLPSDAGFVGVALGRVFFTSALASGTKRFYSALLDGSATAELLDAGATLVTTADQAGRTMPLTMGTRVLYATTGYPYTVYAAEADGTARALLTTSAAALGWNWTSQLNVLGARALAVGDRFVYQVYELLSSGMLRVSSVKADGTGTLEIGAFPITAWGLFTGASGTQVYGEFVDGTAGYTLVYGFDVTTTAGVHFTAPQTRSGGVVGGRPVLLSTSGTPTNTFSLSTTAPDFTFGTGLGISVWSPFGLFAGASAPTIPPGPLLITGTRVLFRQGAARATANLMVANSDGTGLTTLAAGGELEPVHLGPDRLYYRRIVAGMSDLHSVLLDGTGPVTLASGAADAQFELLAGTRVVFARVGAAGVRDLYVVDADGTNENPLTSLPGYKLVRAVF